MNFLYDRQHKKRDEYLYEINGGGEHRIKEKGSVLITFEDEEFVKANFPFEEPYTRNQWRILGEIENEITRIEESYQNSEA